MPEALRKVGEGIPVYLRTKPAWKSFITLCRYAHLLYYIAMKGFIEFVRTQGVVGLAVGFILGGSINELVKSLVTNIINPLLGVVLNRAKDLSEASFTILGSEILYGAFFVTLINFAVVAAVVYFGIKGIGLDRLDKKKE